MRSARTTRISNEGGVIHDQQDRASARRTESAARTDGLREWQRTRRAGLVRCEEVLRGSTCDNCGMMGHFAKDCKRKGKGKGQGRDGSNGYAKGKGTTMKGAGM